MGSVWGGSGGDGTSDAAPGGEPDAGDEDYLLELVVELEEDDALPDEGPNSAASDRETIGGDRDDDGYLIGARARFKQLPRTLRVAGILAVALVFALTVWPAAGTREAAPQPVPTPAPVNLDLYKVRLSATSLDARDDTDHAVLALQLTNSAAERLEVVSAELWDAVGTRLGSASVWPAEGLGAGTTVSVPVTLPYACDVYGFLPVLPITVRYSISTPQAPESGHDYAYPLTSTLWEAYMRQRAAQCATPDSPISASAIDTTQPIGAPSDPQGFDLTFTIESAGSMAWSVENVASSRPGATITGTGLPVMVASGQPARVSTHWHVDDCAYVPRWSQDMGVDFSARPANPTVGTGAVAGQVFRAVLRPGLVLEMLQEACGI
jgi:hypothetical protein